ncbi:MAG: SUMF1/EgtB/PvdO family nonheme iron enzyme [Desulfobacterales bacterium]
MADIFISYARADREKVRPFTESLEKTGWQVWWDRQIRSGSAFDRKIEQALDEAQCVIVIWSHNSVESDWVRAEAGDGLERGILVSIAIEQGLRVPLRFRNVHTDLLIDLAVDQAPSVFKKILEDINTLIGGLKTEGTATRTETKQKTKMIEPKEKELSEQQKALTNIIGMEFFFIQAGSFTMGSSTGNDDERPPHKVKISKSFYLQTTQVTQGQWQKAMEGNPSNFKDRGAYCPVEQVSWDMTQGFIKKLNKMEGSSKYRLPTEAEWEYACRAGTTTEFSFGDYAGQLGEYAWFNGNSGKWLNKKTHRVGTKKPNPWGLYDMHGNVWEWVEDDWHDTYEGAPADGSAWVDNPRSANRVIRGGGWGYGARLCRSAVRHGYSPGGRGRGIGFRLASSVALGP